MVRHVGDEAVASLGTEQRLEFLDRPNAIPQRGERDGVE